MKILIGYKGVNIGQDLLEIAAEHAKAFDAVVLVVTSMLEGTEKDQKKNPGSGKEPGSGPGLFQRQGNYL